MKLMDKAKQAALAAAVKTGLSYLEKDPEVNIPKLMAGVRPLCDDESDSPQAITRDYTLDIHVQHFMHIHRGRTYRADRYGAQ